MAERIVKGVGMMTRTYIKGPPNDPEAVEAYRAWADSIPVAQPGDLMGEAMWRENAERCRAILESVGMADCAPFERKINFAARGIGEDHAAWIAAEWLFEYKRLSNALAEIKDGSATAQRIGNALLAAQELGRLQERMWWRAAIDPETGKRREALALSGKAQTTSGERGRKMRSDSSFRTVHGKDAQAFAEEIARRSPKLSWTAIRRQVAQRYSVSDATVKNALRNPKKAG